MQEGNALVSVDVFAKVGLEAGMHVADLGCGNLGYFTFPAARIVGRTGISYAVDILKSALSAVENRARQDGLDNVKTIWSNLEIVGATKIPESSLDVALLINTLFQSTRDDLVIREASRLMKKNGKLVVIDWLKIATPFGPPMGDRTNPAEIRKFAEDAGFRLAGEFEAGPYHYGMIFVKSYR